MRISIFGSDEDVILLALLTAVASDIGTVMDAARRAELLSINDAVATYFGLDVADLHFFIHNMSEILDSLVE